jgi:hypothetical protein
LGFVVRGEGEGGGAVIPREPLNQPLNQQPTKGKCSAFQDLSRQHPWLGFDHRAYVQNYSATMPKKKIYSKNCTTLLIYN